MNPKTLPFFHKHLVLSALTLAISSLLLTACGDKTSADNTLKTAATTPSLELSPADIFTVTESTLQAGVTITGQLDAFNHTTVQAQVASNVTKVLVREGESVKVGQVLVLLATQDLSSRLRQADAALASAKAEAILANAVQERNAKLYKDHYVSDIEYKRGVAEASARAENVKAQESLVAIARKALNDAVVNAPMSGIIAKRYVQAGQTVAMSAPLVDIVDLKELELTAIIPAEHVAALAVGQSVIFTVQGFSESFTGKVSRVNPMAEAGTRAVTFYAKVPNPQLTLKAGLFVQGRLAVSAAETGLTIPNTAIRYDEQKQPYVWTLVQQKLAKQILTLGTVDNARNQTLVKTGLQAGDVVVLAHLTAQVANMPIKMAE